MWGIVPVMLAALLGWSAVAAAQSSIQAQAPGTATAPATAKTMIPDAQVEASVLKALAGAPDLANQPMTTTTVYGVVTLSGTVESEALRVEAETIVSKTKGVQKVVDEMTLSGENASAQPAQPTPEPVVEGSPDSDNTGTANQAANQSGGAGYPPNTPNYPPNTPNYGSGAPGYRPPYGGQQAPYPGYAQPGYAAPPVYGAQQGGETVTVPVGTVLRMRIDQTLSSAQAKPGDVFDGIVVSDVVVAGGEVAIPRGTPVLGTVVDAKKAGALTGKGELSLKLTQVTLDGKNYPIVSDVWGHTGANKTGQTVGNAAALGAMGAIVGAAASGWRDRGEGAAIGAGAGGTVGLATSAASGGGQSYVPSEGLLTFHLTEPATVTTVSQAELDRLAQQVPGSAPQPLQRRYPPVYYYGPYGPVYYGPYGPAYYRPYPYGYPYRY
jgi:hypothetical protein